MLLLFFVVCVRRSAFHPLASNIIVPAFQLTCIHVAWFLQVSKTSGRNVHLELIGYANTCSAARFLERLLRYSACARDHPFIRSLPGSVQDMLFDPTDPVHNVLSTHSTRTDYISSQARADDWPGRPAVWTASGTHPAYKRGAEGHCWPGTPWASFCRSYARGTCVIACGAHWHRGGSRSELTHRIWIISASKITLMYLY
jgi:hypothetical protein